MRQVVHIIFSEIVSTGPFEKTRNVNGKTYNHVIIQNLNVTNLTLGIITTTFRYLDLDNF